MTKYELKQKYPDGEFGEVNVHRLYDCPYTGKINECEECLSLWPEKEDRCPHGLKKGRVPDSLKKEELDKKSTLSFLKDIGSNSPQLGTQSSEDRIHPKSSEDWEAKADKAKTVIMKEQFAQPEVQSGLQGRVIEKYNIGEDKQKIIRYASMKSGNNMDFVTTLDVENEGSWDVNIKSHNKNGSYDLGLCQFNSKYFGYLHKDPNWNNPYWQVDRCWESYSDWAKRGILGKRFYGYNIRGRTMKNFHFVEKEI